MKSAGFLINITKVRIEEIEEFTNYCITLFYNYLRV